VTARCALVTGAARRIGRTVALRLADDGWNVVVHHHHSGDEARPVVAEIEAKGRKATAVQGDLGDPDVGRNVIGAANEALGPLRLLVNSASLHGQDSLASLTPENWQHLIDINLRGQVLLMQAFAQQPSVPEGASIVNLLDQQLTAPSPAYFSYFVAKFGLQGATQLAAFELAPAIRVNAIAPGLTLPSAGQTEAQFQARQAIMPLGAGLGPDDVADAVLYLAHARHVTGEVIHVDSGQRLIGTGNSRIGMRDR
jgi:NAD(P)-dependent dehydrogenase (short-subunit alcohol dehydrogenase family)